MSQAEFNEALLREVETGTLYAVVNGDQIGFYCQRDATSEVIENALTPEEFRAVLRQEAAAGWN